MLLIVLVLGNIICNLKLGLTLIATFTSPYCSRYISQGDDKENLFNNQELSMLGNHFLYLYDLTV